MQTIFLIIFVCVSYFIPLLFFFFVSFLFCKFWNQTFAAVYAYVMDMRFKYYPYVE